MTNTQAQMKNYKVTVIAMGERHTFDVTAVREGLAKTRAMMLATGRETPFSQPFAGCEVDYVVTEVTA